MCAWQMEVQVIPQYGFVIDLMARLPQELPPR